MYISKVLYIIYRLLYIYIHAINKIPSLDNLNKHKFCCPIYIYVYI